MQVLVILYRTVLLHWRVYYFPLRQMLSHFGRGSHVMIAENAVARQVTAR